MAIHSAAPTAAASAETNAIVADDYYQTLGVNREATPDEIQKPYRLLARKYHPDLNPDDKTAKEKFQKVQAAFDVLNDPDKRAKYDRFGAGFESAGQGPFRGGPWAGQPGGAGFEGAEVDLGDIFGQFTGGAGGGGFADMFKNLNRGKGAGRNKPRPPERGADLEHEIEIPFRTAVEGGEVQVTVERQDGHLDTLAVKVPVGVDDGAKIRLRGQGEEGPFGGNPGDILIRVRVGAHPSFQRKGNRLDVRVPITLGEAAKGAKVEVPTPKGTIMLTIPPGTSSGAKFRVRGHGVAAKGHPPGDLFAEVEIMIPKQLDEEDLAAIEKISEKHPLNPRADLRW